MLWVPFWSILQDGIVSQGIYLSWGILLSLAINLGSWGRLGISSELRQRPCIHLTLCRAGRWLSSLGITVEQRDPLCFHTPSKSWLCSTVDFLYLSYKPHPDSSPNRAAVGGRGDHEAPCVSPTAFMGASVVPDPQASLAQKLGGACQS